MSKKILLVVFSLLITASITGCYIDSEWDDDWGYPRYDYPVFAITSFVMQNGDNQSIADNQTFTISPNVKEAAVFELYVREEGSTAVLPTPIYSNQNIGSVFSQNIVIKYAEAAKQLQQGTTFLTITPGKKYFIVGRAYRYYGDFAYGKANYIDSPELTFTLLATPPVTP